MHNNLGIFPTDVFLKTMLEESLQDIKNNLWLLDYIMWDFTHNPFLKQKYGQKQVDSAKIWFQNNNINVFLQYVKDKEKFPCIVISLGSSTETQELRTMGDVTQVTVGLTPMEVGQKIPYVVPPFTPSSFDASTGTVGVPTGVDISAVSAGMVLLNPANGSGVPVLSINGQNIIIKAGLELDASQLGVVPQYRYFQTRFGRSFFQENWSLTCASNDPETLIWLHTIVIFSLLRYREFMEHNGILEYTGLSSTDIFNPDFSNAAGEEIYCRQININTKCQQNWPRDLHKKIESVQLRSTNPEAVTVDNPEGYVGGIVIASNASTPALQQNDTLWYTLDEND